ncbi:MAG TPA: carboxyltransferase domain-containing protein [Pseudomonadales bacterium]
MMTATLFGTSAVRIRCDAPPSAALSQSLAALADDLAARPGVLDVAIGYTEVVAYTAGHEQALQLQAQPISLPAAPACRPQEHVIHVDYCGEDLGWVARQCGLSEAEIVRRHSAASYTVAMIGFQPHFPYLHGLDATLHVPRRDNPRSCVRAGAVAMAAGQAGIYPCDTPGGWHVLGYCDPALCVPINAGDRVIFRPAP